MNIDSILNVTCSRSATMNHPPKDCNLLDELLSTKYVGQQNTIINETDTEKQKTLKYKMPVLLPCCICKESKTKESIIAHTGLIVIDIDEKDNLHISNFSDLKEEIIKISNVAYCGLSVRGKGYFLIIPIAYPDKHEQHFDWLQKFFVAKGLKIDTSCRNVNRLRYYSYDKDAYYNHVAKPLQAYYTPPITKSKDKQKSTLKLTGNVYNDAMIFAESKAGTFKNAKHNYIFYLCCYLRKNGIAKPDAERWINENLIRTESITSNCISYAYRDATESKVNAIKAPIKAPASPADTNTPPPVIEPANGAVLPPQVPTRIMQADYFAINRMYFLQNMITNIINGYSRTMLKEKHQPATKEKHMQCYWNDVKHLANEYNISIEDLQPFLTV